MRWSGRLFLLRALLCLSLTGVATAQTHITTPKQEFGSNFGDDYFLDFTLL